MRRIFLAIGCLLAISAGAQDYYPPNGYGWGGPVPGAYGYGAPPADYYPYGDRDYRPLEFAREMYENHLDREIARLEGLLSQETPRATGRPGEVTARFGPQWSPYFWEQVTGAPQRPGEMPGPGTPEAHRMLVEMAGRALRRYNALYADRLLELYELRAMQRLSEEGVPPSLIAAELRRADNRQAALLAAQYAPGPGGSVAKVATFRNPAGFELEKDSGPQVLDALTFVPDEPRNIVLMVTLRATMERMSDEPSTTAFGLDIQIPLQEAGVHKRIPGPTLYMLDGDPRIARKGSSSLCTGHAETLYGGLHDQSTYRFFLVAPDKTLGGNVKIRDIVSRVYYITGFVEAGTFE